MGKKLEAYRLAVELDGSGSAKGLNTLKEADALSNKLNASLQHLAKGGVKFGLADQFKTELKEVDKLAGSSRVSGVQVGESVGGGFAEGLVSSTSSLLGTAILPGIGTAAGMMIGQGIQAALSKVAGPVLGIIKKGLDLNEVLEGAETHFTAVLGSMEAARGHLDYLDKLEPVIGIDMRELISASQRLEEFNSDIGLTEVELKAAGVQAKVFGSGVSGFHTIADALGLIAERGELSTKSLLKLNKQGIPAMKYLAEATGLSEKKLKQWADAGQLDGAVAARLISEGIIRHKGATAESLMENTVAGQKFRFEDNLEDLAAAGTRNVYRGQGDLYRAGNAVLESDGAAKFAGFVDSTAGSIINQVKKAVDVGVGVGEGVIEGIGNAEGKLKAAVGGFASKAVEFFKSPDGFDINSPSKKTVPIGESAGEGVVVGFEGYMQGEGLQRLSASVRETVAQARSRARLEQLAEAEPDFLPKLKRLSEQRGINPDHLLNVMALETAGSFRKNIDNGMGYVGLIQFGEAARKDVGLPAGLGAAKNYLGQISATQQLDYVFRYLDQHAHDARGRRMPLDTQAKVYAAVGPGHLSPTDDTVLWSAGSRGFNNNQAWNFNRDGVTQQWELGMAAVAKLGAGVNFTVGGSGVSPSNPLPVTLVRAGAAVGDLKGGTGMLRDAAEAQEEVFAVALSNATDEVKTEFVEPVKNLLHTILPTSRRGLGDMAMRGMAADLRRKERERASTHAPASSSEQEQNASQLHKGVGDLTVATQKLKQLGEETLGQFASGLGNIAQNWVLMGSEADMSAKKVVATVLASASAQAATMAIMETAYGIAALTPWGALQYGPAALHFKSAALFGIVAVGAGLIGRGVAGDSFKDKGTASSQADQNQGFADESNPANNYQRRAFGGPVYRGRSYVVGDGGRSEVFEPNQDGRIHPSVDAYVQSLRGRQHSLERGGLHGMERMYWQLLDRLANNLDRMETWDADQIVRMGAPKAAAEIASANVRGLGSNPRLVEQTNRTLRPATW